MSECWICSTCGVQYEASEAPPPRCFICEDERQYVGLAGQSWTTPVALRAERRNVFVEEEVGLWSVRTEPLFGIGQRAYLIQTGEGNLLWDSISLVNEESVARVRELGGVRAIAVSHPHYYSAMADWSAAFGDVPVYVHEDDRQWVAQPCAGLRFWSGETMELFGGVRLVRSGGHFAGYQVALWPDGANGAGALFAGDQPQVCLDKRWVTFMYSYPNWIPLNGTQVKRITASLEGLVFDRLYGAFGRNIVHGAKDVIARSEERYLRAIAG